MRISDWSSDVCSSDLSPFRAERDMARGLFADGEFIEIFVDTSLAVSEQRDVKGLYAQARAGRIDNFTGIGSEYEPPLAPQLLLDTTTHHANQLLQAGIDPRCSQETPTTRDQNAVHKYNTHEP